MYGKVMKSYINLDMYTCILSFWISCIRDLRKDELLQDSYCDKYMYMHIGFGPMVYTYILLKRGSTVLCS